jgi:predicted amidohydrolase
MSTRLVAAIQMTSGPDKSANLAEAVDLVTRAARRGAALIVLPELFTGLGDPARMVAQAEPIPGPAVDTLSQVARAHRVTLVAGSLAERAAEAGKVYNTSVLLGPDGQLLARYRKMHLFHIDLPGRLQFREADLVVAGERIAVTDTLVGRVGQAICFDLRFPEQFRQLVDQGAECVALPSAFTTSTGPDHWEVLLRARAIENQVYVIAANQFGRHGPHMESHGRSMIVDPWGVVLATARDGVGIVVAEVDGAVVQAVRERLPALKCRR